MIRKFKKQITLLFTGSFTMVLAACYGVPIDLQNEISVQTITEQNQAIQGLKVTMINNGERVSEDISNEDGYVYYPFLDDNEDNDYSFKVEDIDGEENGGKFKSQVIDIHNYNSDYTVEMTK